MKTDDMPRIHRLTPGWIFKVLEMSTNGDKWEPLPKPQDKYPAVFQLTYMRILRAQKCRLRIGNNKTGNIEEHIYTLEDLQF